MIAAAEYQALRPYLFSIAYRMLGRASEAEDVVHDAWLRAAESAPADLRSPRKWLSTVVTRLCLDRLKSARATREAYPGPWLPDPVPTSGFPDLEDSTLRRESITLAFLVLLEVLSPVERAAFLLREVFEYDYAEVARILETSEAACRQLVHRAKQRIAERRPRFSTPPERQREIVSSFLEAAARGDLRALEAVLARDVVHEADGGGKAPAATRPVVGPDRVARLYAGLAAKAAQAPPGAVRFSLADVNGETALLVDALGRLETVIVFTVEEDRITALRAVRNPDKLAWMERTLRPGNVAG